MGHRSACEPALHYDDWKELAVSSGSAIMSAPRIDERFQTGAEKYAAYLETPEGRLRTDIAFAHLQEFVPASRTDRAIYVLDVGCGTGAIGVHLAQRGCRVVMLDISPAMLAIASRAAEQARVSDRVTIQQGDGAKLANFPAASFDVVVCHNLLEFVEEPTAVLQGCARVLRDRSSVLSIVVRNQAGEVLKAALNAGDLDAAIANLNADWGHESLYGEKVRLFTGDTLLAMVRSASLEPIAEQGIRVAADYLPPGISREKDYGRILELEKKLGRRPEFARVARYLHVLARSGEKRA